MKISKNLLQAILIGATLGTAVSSCGTVRENSEIVHEHNEECGDLCTIIQTQGVKEEHNCPGCGMG